MAELNKRLQLQNNSGTIETAKLYTTTAELISGKQYLSLEVDGVGNAYAQLDEVGAVNPTRGRFYRNADGKTYQICSQAAVPYGEQAYTTPGTYTFTVPANVTRVKVAMCGGGSANTGDKGQASSFANYLIANTNLNSIKLKYYEGDRPDAATIAEYRKNSIGYKLGFDPAKESTFSVGYGYGGYSSFENSGTSNHDGYYYFFYPSEFKGNTINVTPNETISCVVGAGGRGVVWDRSADGGNGFILIGWGGEIR